MLRETKKIGEYSLLMHVQGLIKKPYLVISLPSILNLHRWKNNVLKHCKVMNGLWKNIYSWCFQQQSNQSFSTEHLAFLCPLYALFSSVVFWNSLDVDELLQFRDKFKTWQINTEGNKCEIADNQQHTHAEMRTVMQCTEISNFYFHFPGQMLVTPWWNVVQLHLQLSTRSDALYPSTVLVMVWYRMKHKQH